MRIHLFEFEDQSWFPVVLRKGMLDYLRYIFDKINIYKPITSLLKEVVDHSGRSKIIDLCSGSGGDIVQVHKNLEKLLNKEIKVVLSDKYPNLEMYEQLKIQSGGKIDYFKIALEASDLKIDNEIRTIFSSFHHFKPSYALKVLKNAVDHQAPIAVFDGGVKNVFFLILMLFLHPILIFLTTPFIRPFSFKRLLFTYIIPLIPLCTMWDGTVSLLRLYEKDDFVKLIASVDNGQYYWKNGKVVNHLGLSIAYLIGYPNSINRE